jgi:hypothetical protein
VKHCVFFFLVSIFVLTANQLARADQSSVNDFGGQIMSDGTSGRVGIGTRVPAATLDVYQGEIKLGSTGAPCTKALNGALRSENSKLQFCDGARWRNVSLDKSE